MFRMLDLVEDRSPYAGLAPYGKQDADRFVGRGREGGALADRLVRAFAYEQLWRNLFPRQDAELWMLADDRALERARAWKAELRERVRGVQVTVQGVLEGFEAGLHSIHVPDAVDLEREWRAATACH